MSRQFVVGEIAMVCDGCWFVGTFAYLDVKTQDAEENSDESSTFSKKNLHRKEAHRWSHVKISFDSESLRIEQEPALAGAPTTTTSASQGISGVVTTATVPPSIKIIGKEVSRIPTSTTTATATTTALNAIATS